MARDHMANKFVYIVLAIFLGNFGVHKFYCGKTKMGILYLVFCWTGVPAIIGFIEAILAIFKPADAANMIWV
ncbi:TM2 domain-containing protein [Slackia heliotrinireducens]|uniref:TM2 domain-containing protein n=1 Tax=Slackia heliotrinireducens TaxID=84110 RepID=UPI00331581DB